MLVKRLIFDWELLRDNGPAPLREDVRSNSRVWYAKGAEEPDIEPVEDTEFERSIRNYVMLERRVITGKRSVNQYEAVQTTSANLNSDARLELRYPQAPQDSNAQYSVLSVYHKYNVHKTRRSGTEVPRPLKKAAFCTGSSVYNM